MSIIEKSIERRRQQAEAEKTTTPGGTSSDLPSSRAPIDRETRSFKPIASLSVLKELSGLVEGEDETSVQVRKSQFRAIRRRLLSDIRATSSTRSRVIAVTSALSGEGKTHSSLNLALSMARDPEVEVLLVDADLPKRDLSQRLGLAGRDGLAECLLNATACLEEVAIGTAIPRLSVLPAGRAYEEAGEALGSAALERAIFHPAAKYSRLVVILDAGPLLLSAEAETMVREAGRALLVVRHNSTPRQAVSDAAARVPNGVPVSAVLNAWEPSLFSPAETGYYDKYYGKPE